MPKQQKAGYVQDASPQITEDSPHTTEANALQYWYDELKGKEEATKERYKLYFSQFLEFIHKTADELMTQRQEDALNKDIKIQRRIESQFLTFLTEKKNQGYAVASRQIMFAAIRSFFEIHYYPLRMRKGDYPKGDSNGVRRATKEAILKVLENKKARNKVTTVPLILFIKDSGLRVSDVCRLNYGDIAQQLENGEDFIQINIITEKTNLLAKTFIGSEAITALKEYLEARRKGSQKVEPETITKDSPLFKAWTHGKVRHILRHSMSSQVMQAFRNIGEYRMSAHSLRKKLQTDLEKGGANPNWIDQIIGHELINSRDAYSLPTDEELKEAYMKAYPYIKVYPEISIPPKETPKQVTPILTKITTTGEENYPVAEARNMSEVKQLLAKGYKYEMDFNGVRLFTKK
jgi:site-specific recombinase XerD